MLRTITFNKAWRCFDAGTFFKFREDVNILVGDQGTGKSSLLHTIINKIDDVELKLKGGDAYCYFDFEDMNPRVQREIPINGDVKTHLAINFSSHGEVNNKILEGVLSRVSKETTVIMDESDTALSPRSIIKLLDIIKQLKDIGCQLVIACHNPLLIIAFDEVFSLEHRKWMSSKDYIEDHVGNFFIVLRR